jgi:hypothetical protein
MGPEWDAVQAIVQATWEFGTEAMIHVKGHQDEGNKITRLSLLTRLNVQADKLATSFQRCTAHQGAKAVLCIKGNHVQLHTILPHILAPGEEGGIRVTITRMIHNMLRSFYCTQRIREDIKRRTQWTDAVMDSIDWDSLGIAIRQAREMKIFVTKLHHDLLSTGHRVLRYQAYYEKSCPSCSHEDEDQGGPSVSVPRCTPERVACLVCQIHPY